MRKSLWDTLMDQPQEVDDDTPLLMDINEIENKDATTNFQTAKKSSSKTTRCLWKDLKSTTRERKTEPTNPWRKKLVRARNRKAKTKFQLNPNNKIGGKSSSRKILTLYTRMEGKHTHDKNKTLSLKRGGESSKKFNASNRQYATSTTSSQRSKINLGALRDVSEVESIKTVKDT
ncbi:hypothetical protein Q1695_013288 [Nippostrongylus brasiliensis]|nr:hypothetical protein Q1695_013288 [Nippostrongylus brasiliensis]